MSITCPYCGSDAVLRDSAYVYGRSYGGKLWVCSGYPQCDSFVGCHPGGKKPLGTLADAETRRWRHAAHSAFDPLWKTRTMSRSRAYAMMAEVLQIDRREAHIGMLTAHQCKRLIYDLMKGEAVTPYREPKAYVGSSA